MSWQTWAETTFQKLDKKLSKVTVKSRYKIPYSAVAGVHDDKNDYITWWTNGFWGGLNWLMFEETKNPEYMLTAQESEKMLERAFLQIDGLHHDVGFMYHLTSGASYRLTGNTRSRAINLLSAMTLSRSSTLLPSRRL